MRGGNIHRHFAVRDTHCNRQRKHGRIALRLRDGVNYALMANALSPEFTADRVKIGEDAEWVKRFVGSAPWATAETLREFIGPNWLK